MPNLRIWLRNWDCEFSPQIAQICTEKNLRESVQIYGSFLKKQTGKSTSLKTHYEGIH